MYIIIVVVEVPNVPSPRQGKAQAAGGKDGLQMWMYEGGPKNNRNYSYFVKMVY
jgi:hypothetical protein